MPDYSEFVPNVHFEQIPIKDLVSNQDYQRNLSLGHINRAAENFDLYQINPVKVSRRDGVNYVFNGQHTIEIVALVSGSRETPVWCMIYDDLSYTAEANIFANQQKFVKPLQPYEVFNANVEAGNDTQLIIKSLVESYGLTIGNKKGPGIICAVSTLENIYTNYGMQTLNRTLRLIIGAWEGDLHSFSANILNAVAKLVSIFGDGLNDDIFKEKLGAVSVKQLTRVAKERKSGCMGFAETMIIEYNGKKKSRANRLSMGRFYSKGYSGDIGEDDEDDSLQDESESEYSVIE